MRRYRLLDTVDWDALNGQQVRLEVSPTYLIAVTKEGQLIQIGHVIRERVPAPTTLAKPKRLRATEEG